VKLKLPNPRELFRSRLVFLNMRIVLPLFLLAALTGCASTGSDQALPEQSQSAAAEPSQTMDPMESETMDPMETDSMDTMESDESAGSASPSPTASATATPTQSPTPTQTAAALTLSEVAKRNTQSECWVVIDGGVYDLTDWIRQHPGGSGSIRSLCGTDGTAQFTSQHGGEARPSSTLERYYLGPLAG
jgi:cytochrome b involved in lipid metabolism